MVSSVVAASQPRRSPREVWLQGQAHAEQIAECRELLSELETADADPAQRPRLLRLARATRAWLAGKGTISVLTRRQVAMPGPNGDDCQWLPLLGDGEGERARHAAISRWINEESGCPFCPETALRLAWCAIQHEFWLPARGRVPGVRTHQYYHELLRLLDSTATTRGNLHREAPGIYQIFRPSVIYPGRYVVGLFAVVRIADPPRYPTSGNRLESETTPEVLRTIELHRISADDDETSMPPTPALVRAPTVEEIFLGYMVKKSRQVLVHSFNSITRSFQFTVISDFLLADPAAAGIPRRDHARIEMMSGIAVGLVGQVGFYSVPTVLLRVAELDAVAMGEQDMVARLRECRHYEATGILPVERIPPFVLRQFDVIGRQVVLREA